MQQSIQKYSLFRSLALTLVVFLLILFSLNFYQYIRIKSDLASTLLQEINEKELSELRTFVNSVSDKLNIVRDWGKNGVIDSNDLKSLNKKLFPLLDHKEGFTGILLANNAGQEYFLTQKEDNWLTRVTTPEVEGNVTVYTRWQSPEKGNEIRKEITDYDPRKRPWFHHSQKTKEVYWTPLYDFLETQEKGITASVSWDSPDNRENFFVFGIDISLAEVQKLLNTVDAKQTGIKFLVNPTGGFIIPGLAKTEANSTLDYNVLLSILVDQWKVTENPDHEAIKFTYKNRQWLGSLQPLIHNNTVFWIGVTAPEKELLNSVNQTLFKVDLTDILAATAGGMILLFFIWKSGGFHPQRKMVDPLIRLHSLINQGEGARIEFKSTIRLNLKTGKKGKEIEFAWLKAIVAFLNSDGGTLLLGVEDSGRICGIEKDNFENNDRCLLHLKNLINQHIGAEFSGFLDITLLTSEDKDVIMIDIQRAGEPVFLKIGKTEEFYIRSGPSSIKLSPSQMISYVFQNRMVKKSANA
jgi:hypothetical protein